MYEFSYGPYPTKADAERVGQQVIDRWHPAGYGTRVWIEVVDEGYLLCGHRATSCD